MNASCEGSHGISHTCSWRSVAVYARFINFHVVEYGPDVEPHRCKIFNVTHGHLDSVELIKDLLDPLHRWLESRRTLFRWRRLSVLCYAIGEKHNSGSEFVIFWLPEFP